MNELYGHGGSCTLGTIVGCSEKPFFLLDLREELIPMTFAL